MWIKYEYGHLNLASAIKVEPIAEDSVLVVFPTGSYYIDDQNVIKKIMAYVYERTI
jgi:hypothetical protein